MLLHQVFMREQKCSQQVWIYVVDSLAWSVYKATGVESGREGWTYIITGKKVAGPWTGQGTRNRGIDSKIEKDHVGHEVNEAVLIQRA